MLCDKDVFRRSSNSLGEVYLIMIRQGFSIGNRDWWVMAYYDIGLNELRFVADDLSAAGASESTTDEFVSVLSGIDCGFTFTNMEQHVTVICIGRASSYDEMFSTITHEIKHATEHMGGYYGVDHNSEESAYLQGEIAKHMYKAVAMSICPKCGENILH